MSPTDGKEWYLTRSQDYEPGKTLSLGQVLLSARRPSEALLSRPQSRVPISADYTRDGVKRTNATIELQNKLSVSFKAWTELNGSPVAGRAAAAAKSESERKWVLKELESDMFLPDLDYVRKILDAGDVPAYMKWWRLRRRVFLVTGVRIARGASVKKSDVSKASGEAALKADVSSLNVPAQGGLQGTGERETRQTEVAEEISDFVFAYRLHEITCTWIIGADKRVAEGGDTQAIGSEEDIDDLIDDKKKIEQEEKGEDEVEVVGYKVHGFKLMRGEEDMVE